MGGFDSFWNKRMQLFAINPDLIRKASGVPGRRPLILFYGFSFGGRLSNSVSSIRAASAAGSLILSYASSAGSRDGNLFAVAARAVSCGVPPAGARAVN
jgi:hypothetical protein